MALLEVYSTLQCGVCEAHGGGQRVEFRVGPHAGHLPKQRHCRPNAFATVVASLDSNLVRLLNFEGYEIDGVLDYELFG